MNKKLKIVLIIIAVIVLIAVGIVCAVFVFAKDKTVLTAEEFKTKMEENGYTVTNTTSQYVSYDKNIEEVYVAKSENGEYEIEFYVMTDVDNAVMFYNNNKEYLETTKGDVSSQTSTKLKNYSTYTLSTNEKYKVLSRVENTVIYINVEDTYKEEIKDILKELGY